MSKPIYLESGCVKINATDKLPGLEKMYQDDNNVFQEDNSQNFHFLTFVTILPIIKFSN